MYRISKNRHCNKAPNRRKQNYAWGYFYMPAKIGCAHVTEHDSEALELFDSGKAPRESAKYFGFRDKHLVKNFVKRHNNRQKQPQAGIKSCFDSPT